MALPTKPITNSTVLPVKPPINVSISSPTPTPEQAVKTDVIPGRGVLEYYAGGNQRFLPTDNAAPVNPNPPVQKTPTAPATIDTIGNYTKQPVTTQPIPGQNKTNLPTAPTMQTQLSPEEQAQRTAQYDAEVKALENSSKAEIDKIQGKGNVSMGESRSFLSKIGALGRTISGAPLETNMGVLGSVQQKIDAAIAEEKQNLEAKKANLKAGETKAVQDRLDKLNALAQQNFSNALQLIQEDRQISQEERASKISDLQAQKLEFDLNSENKDETIKTLETMASNNVPLDSLTLAQMSDFETKSGMPTGTFAKYYQGLLDYAKIQSDENKLKLDKMKADILKEAAAAGKTTTKTVKVGSGKTGKTYLITYDVNGKEIKRELMGAGQATGGALPTKSTTGTTKSNTGLPTKEPKNLTDAYKNAVAQGKQEGDSVIYKNKEYTLTPEGTLRATKEIKVGIQPQDKQAIVSALGEARGGDGFVSPDDYAMAKNDWISKGGTATAFDSAMKGYRNPENYNYSVGG